MSLRPPTTRWLRPRPTTRPSRLSTARFRPHTISSTAVITRDADGKIDVAKKHEQPTRHGAAVGLGWGLAIGVVTAILPPVGLVGALAVGGGAGAAIGAVTGHMKGGLNNEDLKALGEVLEQGEAGLIVVYATNMADQVAANIKAVNRAISHEIDANADALAEELKKAQAQDTGDES